MHGIIDGPHGPFVNGRIASVLDSSGKARLTGPVKPEDELELGTQGNAHEPTDGSNSFASE